MSGRSASGSMAPSGLLGILRSWLRVWSSRFLPSTGGLPNQAGAPAAHPNDAVRVLVVDDNQEHLAVISALLESRGVVPLLASGGAEAVVLACETPVDLILMDLQMPIFDGLQATATIRHFESTCSRPAVPVVAYSSTPPSARVLAAYAMNGSLAKPCAAADLEDCLLRWCPGYRAVKAARGAA